MLLAQLAQRLDGPTAHKPVVSGVLRDVNPTHSLDDLVEQRGSGLLDPAFALSTRAYRVGDVVPLGPYLEQLRDKLRRILQVCVDDHDDVALTVVEASGESNLLSEVAGQVNDRNASIDCAQLVHDSQRTVPAAIVYEDDLVRIAERPQNRNAPAIELVENLFFVVGRHDNGDARDEVAVPMEEWVSA